MGAGYTRQSAAEIQTGEVIEASPINAEFNQLQNAFDGTTGHTHDGTVGEGPKINLSNSVVGVLPVANGGSGGINKVNATTAPTVTDDVNDGYVEGSYWVDVTGNVFYVCVDATAGAAIWQRYQLYDAGLTSIAGLTTAADKMIYTTASDTYAVTDLTSYARTLLDDANASAAQTTLGISTFVKTLLDDADAATARATLGLTIGTNVQAQDAELQAIAGLTSAADRVPYFTGSGTAALATFTAAGRALVDDADASTQRTTLGLVIGTDVQAQDATLNALAAYNTNGLITQTAADTFTGRILTGTANEITVTNGNGVSGNPTISIPSAVTLTGKTITGGVFVDPALTNTADNTKRLVVDTSNVATSTSRTLTVPNINTSLSFWEAIRNDVVTSAANYSLTGLSAYERLKITAFFTLSSAAVNLRTSTNNGVSYDSGATDYNTLANYGTSAGGGTPGTAFVNSAQIALSNTNSVTTISLDLTFDNFNKARTGNVFGTVTYITGGVQVVSQLWGTRQQATARDAFQILPGNPITGTILVEGVRG